MAVALFTPLISILLLIMFMQYNNAAISDG